MERLTSDNPLTESNAMNLSLADLYMRLKSYEDVGLAPEEIKKKLRTLRHYEDKFGDRPAKRWDELCVAEEQGRLIVLPCRVGDTVYYIKTLQNGADTKVIDQDTVKRIILDGIDNQIVISYSHAFMMSDFNRLLFLSREEAEKALEGMK